MAVPNDTSNGHVTSINKVISTATAMMANPSIKGSAYNCYADEKFTITTQCYGASAIGDGAFLHLDDHVNGLATLARQGAAIPRTYILSILDANDKAIYNWTQPKPTQVVKQDAAYIVDSMASDPNASYLPGSCSATTCTPLSRGGYKFHRDNGWEFAIKTGTTNNGFDGLMTSWSTQFAVVSWVGGHTRNVDISLGGRVAMETLTEPLTRGLMEAAHQGVKVQNWQQPSDIQTLPAYNSFGHINHGDIEPGPAKDVFPSWYVAPKGSTTTSQTIDLVSGKLATSCTPNLAKKSQDGNAGANQFAVDIFFGTTSSVNANTNGSDDVHKCDDQTPVITLTQGACEDALKCDFTVAVTQGTNGLSGGNYTSTPAGTISLLSGGQTLQTTSIPATSSSSYNFIFSSVPVTNGQSVSAMVVDSVLYDSTSTPVTVSNPHSH